MTAVQADAMTAAVAARRGMLVVGGAGSGKTTLQLTAAAVHVVVVIAREGSGRRVREVLDLAKTNTGTREASALAESQQGRASDELMRNPEMKYMNHALLRLAFVLAALYPELVAAATGEALPWEGPLLAAGWLR